MLGLVLVLLASAYTPVIAAPATQSEGPEPFMGTPLCPPDVYLTQPSDCLALGPSQTLTDLARKGIVYPIKPLPASKPAAALNEINARYAKVNVEWPQAAKLYGSFDDAISDTNSTGTLSGSYLFVSYVDAREYNGGTYVMTKSGVWLRASPTSYVRFQGLLFDRNPESSFGWTVNLVRARSAPSYAAPEVGDQLPPEYLVQIYDVVEAEGQKWYMIGDGQWIDRLHMRQAVLHYERPPGVTGDRWIEVNLYEQILFVYENGRLLFATMISSGAEPYFTKPGTFQIYKKLDYEWMRGSFTADKSDYYSLEDVPYTLYYDEARAIHGAYWRPRFGFEMTHGCVNLSVGDAAWVYNWSKEGDWVYVWDPSGMTPTDPSFYGPGGF